MKVLQFIIYLFFLLFAGIFSILPFRIAYIIADGLYVVLYYLVGYRKKVVLKNLRASFPEKSEQEIQRICKKFYHHLADIFIESMKGFTMSKKQVNKRHIMLNSEMLKKYTASRRSLMVVVGHYNNWEWGTLSGGLFFNGSVVALYKPLSNTYIDKFMKKKRHNFGTEMVSIGLTARAFQRNKDHTTLYIFAADQSPAKVRNAIWMDDFLGQETACLHGADKYSRMYNLPVIYLQINKLKRGHYEMEAILIADKPNDLEEGEVVRRFMRSLESTIKKNPEYWLWSHKRWKKKRVKNKESN